MFLSLFQTGWNNGRFVAEYKQFYLNQSLIPNHASVPCNGIGKYLSHGTVHSTNYPLAYFGQDRCQYTRTFGKNITAVKVLFTRIDTNTPQSGSRICHMIDKNDYVQIKSRYIVSGRDSIAMHLLLCANAILEQILASPLSSSSEQPSEKSLVNPRHFS